MRMFLVLAGLAGCSGGGGMGGNGDDAIDVVAARQLPVAIQADAAAVAKANNQFACDLYGKLGIAGNAVVSPFSISTALAMLDAGAAGTTDAELRAALHVALPGDHSHAAYGALLNSLDTGRSFGMYTLATADRLFGQSGMPFQQPFLDIARTDYGAPLMPVDFHGDIAGARAAINTWVADQTDHEINELFGSLDPATVLAMVNAIVFKGSWEHTFTGVTTQDPFRRADGTTVQAPTMHKHDTVIAASIPGGRLILLPFAGKDLSMALLVPFQPDGLPAIETALTGDAIAQWIGAAKADTERVDVSLPKFAITTQVAALPAVLAELGIRSAFDPATADLSGIDGLRDLFVGQVVHQAVIRVDELGATAAAATGVGAEPASVPAPIIIDRPFVFMIYDHVTGSVLFMGRLADPTAV